MLDVLVVFVISTVCMAFLGMIHWIGIDTIRIMHRFPKNFSIIDKWFYAFMVFACIILDYTLITEIMGFYDKT